jgi:hypothetical protein
MAADKLQDGKCEYCVDGCAACDARAQPNSRRRTMDEDDDIQDYKRPWVGLTDEEIKEIVGPYGDMPIKGYTRKLFDQIEAKLRSKNNA